MTDDEDANALDAALADIVWQGQLNPAATPRIIWCSLVPVDFSYAFPGKLWPDGRARIVVNRRTRLNVGGVLRQLARLDASEPGAEPPVVVWGAS